LREAKEQSRGLEIREKSKVLRSILGAVADRKNYCLRSRK